MRAVCHGQEPAARFELGWRHPPFPATDGASTAAAAAADTTATVVSQTEIDAAVNTIVVATKV
jgi:hypothetical protein